MVKINNKLNAENVKLKQDLARLKIESATEADNISSQNPWNQQILDQDIYPPQKQKMGEDNNNSMDDGMMQFIKTS